MFREIVLKSIRYSLNCVGMRYTIIFSIALYLYLYMYRGSTLLIVTLILSILMVIASILSDRRNVAQFIKVLSLIGAKKKVMFISITSFISTRSLPIAISYAVSTSYNPIMIPIVFCIHLVAVLILSLIIIEGGALWI